MQNLDLLMQSAKKPCRIHPWQESDYFLDPVLSWLRKMGFETCFLSYIYFLNHFRYCDGNIKMDSSYRLYANHIPENLRNRPSALIKSCMEKRDQADKIPMSNISMTGMGQFTIVDSLRISIPKEYQWNFGNDDTMPSCTCYDWRHSAYPCKHFVAVFSKFPQWLWEALSPLYRNSPFLVLGEGVQQEQFDKDKESCTDRQPKKY